MSVLQQSIVLILNRAWQPIHVRTPQEAFVMMAGDSATALDVDGRETIRPVSWEEWLTLPVRPQDNAVLTIRGPIRVPTVVVAVNYSKIPRKRPRLCAASIRVRDGNKCQYSGKLLHPTEGSVDHVVPRSRGGKNSWENLVWSDKRVNAAKGSKLPHEAGLKLAAVPKTPREVPVSSLIRNSHNIADWDAFLI